MTAQGHSAVELREAMLACAISEWERVVDCRKDADRITQYFRDCGWQWHLDEHSGGVFDEDVRRKTPHLEYCGIFLGWCGLYLGLHMPGGQCLPVALREPIAYYVLPSTARAASHAKWSQAGSLAPERVHPEDVRRGDIVTMHTSRGLPYGDHYAIVVERKGDMIETIEANASGTLGDGSSGRGVVRRHRELVRVRRVYRLEDRHFTMTL